MTTAQSDKQAQQQQQITAQQQAAAQLAGLADVQRRAAIEANAQGWKAWQAHVTTRCSTAVHQLNPDRSYVGVTIGKTRRPVYQGLILCDRDRAGILKGDELRLAWIVPRAGSKMPMPTGDPPPEFRPPAPIETVQ